MYAAQADAAGAPGLVGHALLATGLLLLVVESSTPLLHPSIKEASGETLVAFALGIALTFGLLLTGIATLTDCDLRTPPAVPRLPSRRPTSHGRPR